MYKDHYYKIPIDSILNVIVYSYSLTILYTETVLYCHILKASVLTPTLKDNLICSSQCMLTRHQSPYLVSTEVAGKPVSSPPHRGI